MSSKNKNLFIFHICVIFLLILFNLGVSAFIRYQELFYIPNENPLGFQFGLLYSLLIIAFIIWALVYFKLFLRHPIISVLIIAGALSNFLEKWLLYGTVTDYISIWLSTFNLADVEIWIGLIGLNISVWFLDKNQESSTIEQTIN